MARLAPILDQQAPFEHDILRYHEHALLEHWPDLEGEPIVEFRATICVRDDLDAEPDFGEGHRAHIEMFERLGSDEGEDFAFRPGTTQFGKDVGIEQPTRHKEALRTGIRVRLGSMSISRCGDACIAAIRTLPERSPLSRRNSSAEITTTSSRP